MTIYLNERLHVGIPVEIDLKFKKVKLWVMSWEDTITLPMRTLDTEWKEIQYSKEKLRSILKGRKDFGFSVPDEVLAIVFRDEQPITKEKIEDKANAIDILNNLLEGKKRIKK